MVRDSFRELAIRMALGASNGRILRTVVSHGMLVAGVGVAFGMSVILVGADRISGEVYAASPTDPWTLGAVTVLTLLIVAASVACSARTATGHQPSEYLHSD